ncbi:MAG TPA: tryptophan synthase subunit alpha [Candidatus Baltobacteraceae bacterium]|nr:tryptophan synthase subunit alpha [Candidatus Baltobacteraceae bacterium]
MRQTIAEAFERARGENRVAFVPYVMAGDPDLGTTAAVLAALGSAGADLIELGIPYGDPLADGPIVAAAGQRALARATNVGDVLALVRGVRDAGGPPVVLFTYFNPVYRYGLERFARDAANAGAAGAIVPDVALEETAELRASLAAQGLDLPLLVAPSTPHERAARIADVATGFVYVVSRLGVTGSGSAPAFAALRMQLAGIRELTHKPLAVGFGLSRPEHVREVAPSADGIIVGSALIEAYAGKTGAAAARAAADFAKPLIEAAARADAGT